MNLPQDGPRAGHNPWLGPAEAVAVLAACVGFALLVTGLLVVLLAPRSTELVFPLEPREPGLGSAPPANERLQKKIEALDVAERVRIRARRRGAAAVLDGLCVDVETAQRRVNGVLADWGYHATVPVERSRIEGEALVQQRTGLLLGVQSTIFLLFGGAFIWLRVRPVPAAGSLPHVLLLGALTGGACFVVSAGIGALQQVMGWSVQEQAWLQALLRDRGSVVSLLPWLVGIVPLSEEVFFRGYLFRFLHQRSGATLAYLVSAGAFSLIHFHPPGMLIYFVVGLFFAWVCRRTASLVAPVVAHMIYNAAVLAVSLAWVGA